MRQSLRKALLWQVVGLLCYLVGMILFLAVAIGVFLAPPANSLANMGPRDVVFMLVSLAIVVTGRVVSWKFGGSVGMESAQMGAGMVGGRKPDRTELEELGYHVPPDGSETGDPDPEFDSGDWVACEECGARNDREYRFCRDCSAELPG